MAAVVNLVDLAPGPTLGAALARIDAALVPNDQLLPLLRAQSRQAAHEAARLLGVIAEVARANPASDAATAHRLEQPSAYAADEVRAALAWSRRAAEGECELAEQLVHELPLVHGAFLRGEIDRSKVRVFAEHLGGLTPTQIEVICESLVPSAGRLTPGQLMHRLRRLVAAVDPRHYERRYRKALRDRHLTAYLDEHGAAVLTARGLTPAQATAALERVDGLAHAVRRAGHPATLDQIRVDLLAGLLDGSLHHLSREEIVAHQITQHSADDRPTSGADTTTAPRPTADDQPAAGATTNGATTTAPRPTADDQRTGVEVRVGLSTLLGRDEHPGEIPALGPVSAAHAREIVRCQRRAEWRFAVTDSEGRPVFDGVTRRRPAELSREGSPGGIVELHITAELLTVLTADPETAGPWAAVVSDIARRYAERATRDLDDRPHDRLPRAALRRHIQIRDRTCVGPGCRRRPRRCDQDHTVDHRDGGPTVAAGLAPLCRHDHLLKHQGGWVLEQSAAGTFVWTSPLGGRYRVRPEPVRPPLPPATPAPDDPYHDELAPVAAETLTLGRPPPPPRRPPEPELIDLDEPPPF